MGFIHPRPNKTNISWSNMLQWHPWAWKGGVWSWWNGKISYPQQLHESFRILSKSTRLSRSIWGSPKKLSKKSCHFPDTHTVDLNGTRKRDEESSLACLAIGVATRAATIQVVTIETSDEMVSHYLLGWYCLNQRWELTYSHSFWWELVLGVMFCLCFN